MNNFEHLQILMQKLDQVEDGLKVLRDHVEVETKPVINSSIATAQAMRERLWQVDKALEKEMSG
jgi:hypothetical protein